MELYTTLPLTFFLLLLELIVGTAIAVLLVEPQLEVGPGFMQFMGVSLLLAVLLALWSGGDIDAGATRALYGAAVAAALYTLFSFRPRQLPRVAGGAALAGTSGVALATTLGSSAPAAGLAVGASFAAASLAMGASMTGMLLGHWYLVAPMLSSRPLLRLTGLFLGALVLQGGILVWLLGAHEVLARFELMLWMRAAFGIIFPLVMGGFVWYSCRIRAMRTATGILYLAVGCVVMGDVTAKVLYFLTAVPV